MLVFNPFKVVIILLILSLLSCIPNTTLVGKPIPGGTAVGRGRFFNILKAISKIKITFPVIPSALVVDSIIFKTLFNCLTSLFFLLIKRSKSSLGGHVI